MPATFEWMDEPANIGLVTISGKWTWDEYAEASAALAEAAQSVEGDLYIVTDMTEARGVPPNAMSQGRRLFKNKPENLVLTVIVGVHPFVRTMANMFLNLYRVNENQMALVDTVADAQAKIAEHRAQSAGKSS